MEDGNTYIIDMCFCVSRQKPHLNPEGRGARAGRVRHVVWTLRARYTASTEERCGGVARGVL
eukprot:7237332-Prorocentrum_lima.AAC.1